MSVLVIRHALSDANNRGSAAFGMADAALMEKGRMQAAELGQKLRDEYGLSMDEDVAVSEMLRSRQTAEVAGFTSIKSYQLLNEVDVPKTPELRAMLDQGIIVEEAFAAGRKVLENPPQERVWVTHGYLFAAICELTGVDTTELRFIPRFCEIRELPV